MPAQKLSDAMFYVRELGSDEVLWKRGEAWPVVLLSVLQGSSGVHAEGIVSAHWRGM